MKCRLCGKLVSEYFLYHLGDEHYDQLMMDEQEFMNHCIDGDVETSDAMEYGLEQKYMEEEDQDEQGES